MTHPLTGIFAPVTTPFDPRTGEYDPTSARANAARLFADGLSGLVVGGSTGEGPLLEPRELCEAIAVARAAAPEGRRVVAGTGAESTRGTIALSHAAAAAGADAVLVRPPAYFAAAYTRASLTAHFAAVADASPVPVLLYNIPKYTRVTLEPGLLHDLATHGNIIGVKDSSGDVETLAAYRAAAPSWAVLVGSAAQLVTALAMGCRGGIVAVACFAAARCVALHSAVAAGDAPRVAALQTVLASLDRDIVAAYGPAGVKAAMDAVGLGGGPVRPPLASLERDVRERVARLVAV